MLKENENQFIDGDKLYIKNIRSCVCREKCGDNYILHCKIKYHGKYDYIYKPGDRYITNPYGNKHIMKELWLTDDSAAQAEDAIKLMEERSAYLQANGYAFDAPDEKGLAIYYEYAERPGLYNCLVIKNIGPEDVPQRVTQSQGVRQYLLYESKPLKDFVCALPGEYPKLENVPFYSAAVRTNDILLQNELKLYFGSATEKECAWLSEVLGIRLLPPLSEAFDKTYYVSVRDATRSLVELLNKSGYRISHRPYFAYGGNSNRTPLIWSLNPHTKSGADNAPKDSPDVISLAEYAEMIEANRGK